MDALVKISQLVVGCGLLNVWLIRFKKATEYRGAQAKSMKEEFAAYGLPEWFCYVVGGLKIVSGILLISGIFVPGIAIYPAAVVSVLMIGALGMHWKVRDPLKKSLPAASVLALCLLIMFGSGV
jgi:uncharacterized membrane protein YphA (DoxX/SURF4 family)